MRLRSVALIGCALGLSACAVSHDEADVTYHVESEFLTGCQNATGVISPVRAGIPLDDSCLLLRMPYVGDSRVGDVSGVRVEGGPYLPDEMRFTAMACREWFIGGGAIDRADEVAPLETAAGWLRADMGTPFHPRLEGEVTFDGGDGILRRFVLPPSIVPVVVGCGF